MKNIFIAIITMMSLSLFMACGDDSPDSACVSKSSKVNDVICQAWYAEQASICYDTVFQVEPELYLNKSCEELGYDKHCGGILWIKSSATYECKDLE